MKTTVITLYINNIVLQITQFLVQMKIWIALACSVPFHRNLTLNAWKLFTEKHSQMWAIKNSLIKIFSLAWFGKVAWWSIGEQLLYSPTVITYLRMINSLHSFVTTVLSTEINGNVKLYNVQQIFYKSVAEGKDINLKKHELIIFPLSLRPHSWKELHALNSSRKKILC